MPICCYKFLDIFTTLYLHFYALECTSNIILRAYRHKFINQTYLPLFIFEGRARHRSMMDRMAYCVMPYPLLLCSDIKNCLLSDYWKYYTYTKITFYIETYFALFLPVLTKISIYQRNTLKTSYFLIVILFGF
jgi:hypothetical protein